MQTPPAFERGPEAAHCDDPETPASGLGRSLITALWQQPIYAVGFALFFGTLYGATREAFWIAFKVSLIFAFIIRVALIALKHWGLPWLRRRFGGRPLPIRIEAPAYLVASVSGSYLAAALINAFMLPGFLGSPLAVARSGAYAVLFTVTIGGVAYAFAFYRQAVERARAIERMRAELSGAELRALRAQVNPHFLFNTLNTIAALVRVNPAEAEDTITRLADVFRYALRASERDHARLAEELEFVRAYLDIERTRFGDRLRVEERIEPGLEGVMVPSLLLQPLVENAVRHGVEPAAEGGVIRIRTRVRLGRAVVSIVNSVPAEASRPGHGMALRNVRERLRLMHDVAAQFDTRREGDVFRVQVVVPL